MEASEELINKLKSFEALRLIAYKCPAGVWTIGYGHTLGVKKGQAITTRQADALFKEDLSPCEKYVNSIRKYWTQGQFDALVSFCFNAGIDGLQGSTLLSKIMYGGTEKEIRYEFARWKYSNGKVLKGLVNRRKWEADRYFGDV